MPTAAVYGCQGIQIEFSATWGFLTLIDDPYNGFGMVSDGSVSALCGASQNHEESSE